MFTHIDDGIATAEDLAQRVGATLKGVRIVCDFLAVNGLLVKQDGRYGLPLDSKFFLSKRSPAYVGSAVNFLPRPRVMNCFSDLGATMIRGGAYEDILSDEDIWVEYPWKLIYTPNSIAIIYETFTNWRQIFTDDREVSPDANPSWLGYSTGKWDGDTLVVDTRGFNGKIWLDQLGRPTTEKLHVTERFRRPDYGHLMIDVTIDDPGAYTKPWGNRQEMHLRPGWEPMEFICGENNIDLPHLPK